MAFRVDAQEGSLPRTGLPVRTVTFVLGDVAGSTRLWEECAANMPAALTHLDEMVGTLVAASDGTRPVEQGEGDNFVAAFANARDAVAFAAALGRALGEEPWPGGLDVMLRMAVHTGDARQRDEGRYMGEALNRCARLRALAHPGQVLVSAATAALVADQLADGDFLRDLGVHHLRDLSRPERVSQLCGPGLPFEFPPLRSLNRMPHNLPVQLTTFIGRVGEVAEITLLLADRRLVTLVGAGGSGKTRLAVQLGAEVIDRFPDGVWFAPLAPVSDPDLVVAAVASAVGVTEVAGQPLLDTLTAHLASHEALVILDNCEHLGDEGEASYRISCLGLPLGDADAECESVMLFADRAALARPTMRVGPAELEAMTAICRRLDGIPLAIELAAARCRSLTPAQIAPRLDSHFGLLTGGDASALPRHRALEASLEWSYGLLDDDERFLLRALSVFAGGFTLEAAEAVGAAGPLTSWTVVDRLTGLIDKSLVIDASEDGETAGRYRLLEPIRQYALGKLVAAGEEDAARRRHAEFFVELVERVGNAMFGAEMMEAHRCLEAEMDNLRAASDWVVGRSEVDLALRIMAPLLVFWPMGRATEGLRRLEAALAFPGGTAELRAMVLRAAADAAGYLGMLEPMGRYLTEALDLVAEGGNPALRGEILGMLSWLRFFSGDDAAVAVIAEATSLLRTGSSPRSRWGLAHTLWGSALFCMARGDGSAARVHLDEALAVSTDLTNPMAVGRSQLYAGILEGLEGNLARAGALLGAAQPVLRGCGDDLVLLCDASRGWIAGLGGDLDGGLAAARAAVDEARRRRQTLMLAWGALLFVTVLDARAEPTRVPAACDETEQLMAECGFPWGTVWCGAIRAEALALAGDIAGARQSLAAAFAQADRTPYAERGRGMAELALARVERAAGDLAAAEDAAHRAMASLASAGMRLGLIEALELIAGLAAQGTGPAEAARLFAAAARARTDLGYPLTPPGAATLTEDLDRTRTALGDDVFDATWTKGSPMSLDEARAYATRGRGPRRRPSRGWSSLTPTELEVVGLVAEGLSNPDIAARLFVSRETVKSHLSNIFVKLGVTNRTELTAAASRRL
jgi:predicted ATPase/class 3 adenylate cyclase/DNA-binding CsgD family transcriptional regulator